jgi:hypothetical protein
MRSELLPGMTNAVRFPVERRARLCCMDPVLVAGGPVATHIRKPIHLPGTALPCRSIPR